MLLSHKHKFIFIHVPKTGGTSIKAVLEPYADHKYGIPLKHNGAKYWQNQLGKKMWKKYFVFAFVRNPWDRMVSRRFYQKYVNLNPEARERGEKCKTLLEFLNLARSKFVMNQSRYFRNHKNKYVVDFVGRFENLQGDFDIICEKTGLPQMVLPKLNTSPHGDYRQYYDEETKKVVEKACQDDIIRYGYEF